MKERVFLETTGAMVSEEPRIPDPSSSAEFYSKFEMKETLGTGVSSVVKLCMDRKTGEEYAVKIIDVSQDDIHEGLNIVQQVHQEIGILRLVGSHPYIADLIDTYVTVDFIFLIFELCRKGELYELLNSNVHLSEKRIRNYMKQLLQAVKHCHDLGILHRDLKPENILIQDDMEHIKLTDFGLARPLDKKTKLFKLCGTPGYLAPEIYRSGMLVQSHQLCKGYSYPVDSWACGIILFILLFGRPPFYDRRRLKMIKMICDNDHATTGNDWDTITDDAKDLINGLLDKNAETRMTIEQALNHKIFRKNAYLRRLNHAMYVNDSTPTLSREESETRVIPHTSSIKIYKKQLPLKQGDETGPEPVEIDPSATYENEEVQDHVMDVSESKENSTKEERVLTPLQKLRRVFHVVRFIIRLCRLKETPELLDIELLKTKPHVFLPFKKATGKSVFKLYNHWMNKYGCQNRAAIYQNKFKIIKEEDDWNA